MIKAIKSQFTQKDCFGLHRFNAKARQELMRSNELIRIRKLIKIFFDLQIIELKLFRNYIKWKRKSYSEQPNSVSISDGLKLEEGEIESSASILCQTWHIISIEY